VTEPATAEKVALVDPAGTVTEAGTVRAALLLDAATAMPPEGAFCVNCTVHVVAPPDVTTVWLQFRDDSAGGGGGGNNTVTPPPVADTGIEEPSGKAITGWATRTERVLLGELALSATITTATTPSPIAVWFIPQTKHVVSPPVV
jgi:hypothetical protein